MNKSLKASTQSSIANGYDGVSRSELIQLMISVMQRRVLMPADEFITLLETIRASNSE